MANSKISALTSATTPLAGTETLPIVQSSTTKQVSVANLTAGRAVVAGTLVVGPNAKQANNSFEVNVNTSYAGFIQNTGSGTGGTPINPSTNYGLHIGWNRSNGNAESNLVWGSGVGALSDLVIAQWTGTTYSVHTTLKKGGELNVATSNIEIGTAAKGINFSANTPAAGKTSQLLNWYEEGTWTPTIGGTATYYQQYGYYTRVGRLVTVNFVLQVNVIGTGSAVAISGLPFTSANDYGRSSGSMGYYATLAINVIAITPFVTQTGSNSILFSTSAAASAANTDVAAVIGNGAYLMGSLTYRV